MPISWTFAFLPSLRISPCQAPSRRLTAKRIADRSRSLGPRSLSGPSPFSARPFRLPRPVVVTYGPPPSSDCHQPSVEGPPPPVVARVTNGPGAGPTVVRSAAAPPCGGAEGGALDP